MTDTNKIESDLDMFLCEHIWNLYRPIRLAGEDFEVVFGAGEDMPPGYDEYAVLLRRKSDGAIFEADIDVTLRAAKI